MNTLLKTAVIFMLSGGSALAGPMPQLGDFYLISRNQDGYFTGSHKLFLKRSADLKKVSYCNRHYFVRIQSVAWTQLESSQGKTVRVEYNSGYGWRPICNDPDKQVTLKDIGIDASAEDILYGTDDKAAFKNRLSTIGTMFQLRPWKRR